MQNKIAEYRHLTPVSKQAYLQLFDKYLGDYLKVCTEINKIDYQNKNIDVHKLPNEIIISQLDVEQLTVELAKNSRHIFYILFSYDGAMTWHNKLEKQQLPHGGSILLRADKKHLIHFQGGQRLTALIIPGHAFKKAYTSNQLCHGLDPNYIQVIDSLVSSIVEKEECVLTKVTAIISLLELNANSQAQSLYHEISLLMKLHAPDPKFTLTELAAYLGITVQKITQELHKQNTTFTESLLGIRLKLLQSKLLSSQGCNESLTEIVKSCGFSSYNTGLNHFRKYKGMSPKQYQKLSVGADCILQ